MISERSTCIGARVEVIRNWFAVKGSCIWLDTLDPQQQFPGGLPFRRIAITAQFKMASKKVTRFCVHIAKRLTQSFSYNLYSADSDAGSCYTYFSNLLCFRCQRCWRMMRWCYKSSPVNTDQPSEETLSHVGLPWKHSGYDHFRPGLKPAVSYVYRPRITYASSGQKVIIN